MPNTTYSGLPYPVLGSTPNIPQDLSSLATALDQKVTVTVASASARAALSSKYDGMVVREASTDRFYVWDSTASAWVYLFGGITPPIVVALAGGWGNAGGIREYLHLTVASGEVRLRGMIVNASQFSANAVMVNAGGIPVGYRPQSTVNPQRYVDVQNAGSGAVSRQPVSIGSDGSVTVLPTQTWSVNSIFTFDCSWNLLDGLTS